MTKPIWPRSVFLTRDDYLILLEELAGSRPGMDYDPIFRELDKVEPLRRKIDDALHAGCNVVLRPDVLVESEKPPAPAKTSSKKSS